MVWWIILALCGVMALAALICLIIGNIIRFTQGRPLCWLGLVSRRPCHPLCFDRGPGQSD